MAGSTALLSALMAALGWAFGLSGMPLAVMVVAEELITASVAITTTVALISVSLVMAWLS